MCWRTSTPLIYKPIKSWYVRVTKIRELLVNENKDINWIPKHVKEEDLKLVRRCKRLGIK